MRSEDAEIGPFGGHGIACSYGCSYRLRNRRSLPGSERWLKTHLREYGALVEDHDAIGQRQELRLVGDEHASAAGEQPLRPEHLAEDVLAWRAG